MNIISHLLGTSTGAALSGYVIGTSITVSILALCFYFVFKRNFLLTFSLLHLTGFGVILAMNHDPRDLLDLEGDPVFFPLIHLLTALTTILYYQLVVQLLQVKERRSKAVNALWVLSILSVIIRITIAITFSTAFVQIASFLNIFIFLGITYIGLTWHPVDWARKVSKLSLVFVSTFSLYSMARSGLLPESSFDPVISNIVVMAHAVISVIWLFANIEIARTSFEQRKIQELQRRARAFIEIRDMINTPLQILELSVDVLDQYAETDVTRRMRKAIRKLSDINKLLKPFEVDVDWNQDESFFDGKEVVSIKSG